ncbi:MAG TPA: hypothetical protein VJ724_09205, partial [Tahibacter sp.]|nr:hypothetical protein [Tahibacter sp.]
MVFVDADKLDPGLRWDDEQKQEASEVKSWMTHRVRGSAFGPFAARMFASASMPTQSSFRWDDGHYRPAACLANNR